MCIAFLILIASAALVFFPLRYFKRQREICRKYPFYQLRDEVIKGLVTAPEHDRERLLETYKRVNMIISKIKKLNFSFFVEVMTSLIEGIMEKKHRYIDDKKSGINEFEKKFVFLIVVAAKQNSFLLRIAMTKFGYMILFTPALIRAGKRFMKNHPELLQARIPHIKAIWKYSMLAQAI